MSQVQNPILYSLLIWEARTFALLSLAAMAISITASNNQTPQAEKPDGIVHALVDAAHEGKRHTGGRGGQISAVSIAVPGTVNFEDGVVV